ncbi:hypothetical protein I6F15_04855 [Bradyrhizobium sp. BRP14]|nr:hypothetical protein [Bradyrhizobium sp. BRP14]
MSDEASAADRPRQGTALYVHYREHPGCKEWGAFAFAVGKARRTGFASSIGGVGGSAMRHELLMSEGGRPKRQPPSGHRAS